MLDQVITENSGDWHRTARRARLAVDLPFLVVPAALDADDAGRQADIAPLQGAQLAGAEPGIHRRRPQRPVLGRKRGEQLCGLVRIRDAIPLGAGGTELGAELIAAAASSDHGHALLRSTDTGFWPCEALPRVFGENVDDEVRWFNTRIEFAWDPPGSEYAEAAVRELRRRWARRASS